MNRKRLLELAGINEDAPDFDKKAYDAALDTFADQVAKEFISYVREQWEENRQQYESGHEEAFPSFKEYLREIQEDPSQYGEYISGHIADQLYERSNFYLRRYLRAPNRAFVKE